MGAHADRILVGRIIQAYHRSVQVELYFGSEGVDDGLRVPVPRQEGWLAALGCQRIRFDSVYAVVVPGDEQLSHMRVVREPELVCRDEPVWMVANVQLPPGRVGRLLELRAGHIGLHKGSPEIGVIKRFFVESLVDQADR